MSRRVSNVAGGVHEHKEAWQRRALWQVMGAATERRHAAPPPEWTRDTVGEIERPGFAGRGVAHVGHLVVPRRRGVRHTGSVRQPA